jgi:hypothetical protein
VREGTDQFRISIENTCRVLLIEEDSYYIFTSLKVVMLDDFKLRRVAVEGADNFLTDRHENR